MNRKLTSLVDELSNYVPARDRELFIESRARQVIASVVNLMDLLDESYDDDTADELKRRLVNSIKTKDEKKFRRKIKQLREKGTNA